MSWMDYLGKGEVLTNTDLDRFDEQYLREIGLLCTYKNYYIFEFSS